MKNNSRWYIDPFDEPRDATGRIIRRKGEPHLTPEERKRVDARIAAMIEYRETGDPTKAIELGVYPPDTPHGKRGS